MKIDVETLEFEVLEGMGRYLNDFLPIIILEIQTKNIGEKIKNLLDHTYHIFNINEKKGLVNNNEWDDNINKNYLLCPESKEHFIYNFIHNESLLYK